MQELKKLVVRAQGGDFGAYDQLVHRFQDRAVAYGYAILGDFHWAEDAAQEAFVEAFRCLPKLQEPLAFPGWLRRIVFKHCDRITRRKQVQTVPLEAALADVGLDGQPHRVMEEQESASQVREAVAALSEAERSATLLFYMGGHSQIQIAEFLEVPLTTVKKRLHTARKKLKEKIIGMVQEDLEGQRPSRDSQFVERVKTFIPQLSQRVDAGQSLVRSLAVMAELEHNADLRQIIARIQQDITGDGRHGLSLSEAMSKHPDAFSRAYVDAIKQGETGGNLAVVLEQLGRN